jgi:hypothetical protein
MADIQFPVQITTQTMVRPNLNVYYPYISGVANPASQQIMNGEIQRLVNNLIIMQDYYRNPQTQVTGWYEIKTNERNILSLNIDNYGYPPQAAHGMTYIRSLTFDIQTGKDYTLSELFKPGADYITPISRNISTQIKARQIPLLEGFDKISPNQDFYIADKALVIYYQLYEITPYYVGLPMFPISVFDLQDVIREDGPLGRMATNS